MVGNNDKFDTIEAADIKLTRPLEPVLREGSGRPEWWLYVVGTVCLLIVALAFVLLQRPDQPAAIKHAEQITEQTPGQTVISGSQSGTAQAQQAQQAQQANNDPVATGDAPFEQQQMATARRAAQDILARIIEQQKFLQTKQVTQWAAADYQRAVDSAEQGDLLYRRRDFVQAQQSYLDSEARLTAIEARIAPLIEGALAEGLAAINAGDMAKAKASFDLVLIIEPDHAAAQTGLQRVMQLPKMLALVADADKKLAGNEHSAALTLFQQALGIDPKFEPAVNGAQRASGIIKQGKFEVAMNSGYAYMQQADYTAAMRAFRQALNIDAGSQAASAALAQAQNEITQIRVHTLLATAADHEQQERWSAAITTHDEILNTDSSVVAAKVGKIRSQARATLDSDLEKISADPLRLSASAVYSQAQQLLRDARQIQPRGPRLTNQIAHLEQLLVFATTPLSITLQSDNATTVTLLRVGQLGQFNEKIVALKPGNYVAEGIRSGYRDVRIDFVVDTQRAQSPVLIACREPI